MPPLRLISRAASRSSLVAPPKSPSIISIAAQQSTPSARPTQSSTSHFSTATALHSGDSHGSHYDAPGGWLFGVPPGEKYKKEGWEGLWVWGFWGSLGVATIAYIYKPDSSIQTWALEEARRRLEAEGILPDPSTTR